MRRAMILLAIGVLASACGGGGSNNPPPTSSGSSSPPSSAPPAKCLDLSGGAVFTLAMKDFQFHPSCFKARSSQSIHIVNEDSALHNFSITGTGIDVDVAGGKDFNGESAGLDPGTYQFFCKYHKSSGMVGEVTVLSG